MLRLQVHLLRSLKRLQLTSQSFTTLDSDPFDEEQLDQLHSQDQLDDSGSGLVASIGHKPSLVGQSDKATQTDISAITDDMLLSTLHQKTYRSGLYVDSLTPSAKVPLEEDTEVMVVVDSNLVPSPQDFDGGNKKRFRSTVHVVSSRAADGRVTLTPVIQRSVEVTGGQPVGQRSPEIANQGSQAQTFDDSDHRHAESAVHRSTFNSVSLLLPVVSLHCRHYC